MRVIFDDGRLIEMAKDSNLTAEFPFLKRVEKAPKKPGGCGCSRGGVSTHALAGARQAIASMPKERKQQLLRLMGASEGQVSYVDHRRKRITVVF